MTNLKRILILCLFTAFSTAALGQAAKKDQPDKEKEPEKKAELPLLPVPTSATTLSLAECLAIGAEKQPVVRAAIASLRGSEVSHRALGNISGVAKLASPDLAIRLQQSERGLTVASADVQKALQENKYDIIRLYYSFVYARQADLTASDIVVRLEQFYEVAKALSQLPGAKISQFHLFGMEDAISEVKKLRIKARSGQSMALAALKEAMGVEQCYEFVPRDQELPIMGGEVTQEQVVYFATALRPEMAMAAAGVDAFRLEICAQSKLKYRQRVPTLAFGSDLHSRLIPLPHRNGEYRPGALAPEMPTTLIGKMEDRVARAVELSARQDTVFDKTRDLVTLEATNAYLQWRAATESMAHAKARYEKSKVIAEEAKDAAAIKNDPELAIRYQALSGKAQAEYIESVFEHIKTLATLERVTSGGVKPAFPDQ